MRRRSTTLFLAAIFGMSAAAVAHAEPVQLTLGQAEDAVAALMVLSAGKVQTAGEGKDLRVVMAGDKPLRKPFAGWSLPTVLAMSKDLAALRVHVEPFEQAKAKIAAELRADAGDAAKAQIELRQKYDGEVAKLRLEQITVDLAKFKATDLMPDKNEIDGLPEILAALAPILAE